MDQESMLRTKELTKSYSGTVVLNKVSVEIKEGEIHALMGENGAGKTTIIKLILGFYKPTSGEILINGVNIKEYPPEEYLKLFISISPEVGL